MTKEEEKRVSFPDGKNLMDKHQEEFLMKNYEPPKTKKTKVETEGGFCGSVIKNETDSEIHAVNHNVQDDFYTGEGDAKKNPFDFSGDSWD